MKILSLELINFKNHKHAFFQFANINHFFGENFTGKTSIGDAIVFGLFGVTKYLQKSYVSDFIREGTNSMTVKITVEIKGNILEITRSIFGNKQQLEVNSNPVSQNELNKYIGKPQSFIYCFFLTYFQKKKKKRQDPISCV
jgi:DNA repair exonuclease SbcCD ATPase subunit